MDIAVVKWFDAHSDHSWVDITTVEDEPYVVTSVGLLLDNKKTGHITLSQTVGPDGVHHDHVIHIPSAVVVSINRIDSLDI